MTLQELQIGNLYHFSNGKKNGWLISIKKVENTTIWGNGDVALDSRSYFLSGVFSHSCDSYDIRPATYKEEMHWRECKQVGKYVHPKEHYCEQYTIY